MTAVANMIAMHTMVHCGVSIPEDIEEGVRHFSECLMKFGGHNQETIPWRNHRDCFIACWTKLASGSQDTIANTGITFEELNQAVAE